MLLLFPCGLEDDAAKVGALECGVEQCEHVITVTAVQIPLKSLADDVATTKRVIDALRGDVVLVGHSSGPSNSKHKQHCAMPRAYGNTGMIPKGDSR